MNTDFLPQENAECAKDGFMFFEVFAIFRGYYSVGQHPQGTEFWLSAVSVVKNSISRLSRISRFPPSIFDYWSGVGGSQRSEICGGTIAAVESLLETDQSPEQRVVG